MSGVMKVVATLLPFLARVVIEQITPELREIMINTVKSLESRAEKTPNPFDDFAVDVLKGLFAPGTF